MLLGCFYSCNFAPCIQLCQIGITRVWNLIGGNSSSTPRSFVFLGIQVASMSSVDSIPFKVVFSYSYGSTNPFDQSQLLSLQFFSNRCSYLQDNSKSSSPFTRAILSFLQSLLFSSVLSIIFSPPSHPLFFKKSEMLKSMFFLQCEASSSFSSMF